MGKIVQEWNPIPAPVYTNDGPPGTAPKVAPTPPPSTNNAGFNDLFSQVAIAPGIVQTENTSVNAENAGMQVKPPDYKECTNTPKAFLNLAFEGSPNLNVHKSSNEQNIRQSNPSQQGNLQTNSSLSLCFDRNEFFQSSKAQETINSQKQQIPQTNLQTQQIQQTNLQTQQIPQTNLQTQQISQTNLQTQQISQTNPQRQQVFQTNPQRQQISQTNLQPQQVLQANPQKQQISPTSLQTQQISQTNPQRQEILDTNQTVMQPNPVSQEISFYNPLRVEIPSQQTSAIQMSTFSNSNRITGSVRLEEPSTLNMLERLPDVSIHSERFQPVKQTDEKGVSVSIQTRIVNTRVTKSRIRRRKDLIYPSDSTSDKESKRGFLLHNNDFKGINKYRRRRKRNQMSYQDKITADNVPYDMPALTENQINNPK